MAIKVPKLKVAVAGTSFGGLVQIPVFQSHPRTQVVAVSSGRPERAAKIAKEQRIPAHYTDFEEMLDREKPDLVSVVTPPDLHCPMTMAALSRRIHVLCEKPFAMSLEEATRMRLAADEAGVVAMIDFEFRFLPARAYALELLRQKYVGRIRMAHLIVRSGWRSQTDEPAWNWWADASRGGGALGALGSHAIDTLRAMMGPPRRVWCDLVSFIPERGGRPVTADDSFTLIIEFHDSARAVVQMTAAAGLGDSHFGIYGSEGQLTIPDPMLSGADLYGGVREDSQARRIEIPEQYRLKREDHHLRAPFRALVNRMIHAIDNRLPAPSPDFTDGFHSQAVLDAARLSSREQRWIDVVSGSPT